MKVKPLNHNTRKNIVLTLLCIQAGCRVVSGSTAPNIKHTVDVYHPGMAETTSVLHTLVQRQVENGTSSEYYFDAESVFCGDGTCKVVPVRIVWDDLGVYKRYELAPGIELEKAKGELFSKADHKKLNQILSDPNSALKNVSLADINHHEATTDEVDGVSSATPIIYKEAAVVGAAWTSFTLWHWANGSMGPIIRQITERSCSLQDLRKFLISGDTNHKGFAIEQFTKQNLYDAQTLNAIIAEVPNSNHELTKRTLIYLEQAPTDTYYSSLESLFNVGNTTQRTMILNALLTSEHIPTSDNLDQFSQRLATCESYQEADLILRLMESRNAGSSEVSNQATLLLDNKSFLIARRAYWFLGDQQLTASQQQKMETFRKLHIDRL